MAVKQNNTEPNDVAPGTGGGAAAAGNAGAAAQATSGTALGTGKSNVLDTSHISDEGGGIEVDDLDPSSQTDAKAAANDRESCGTGTGTTRRQHDINSLLNIMQSINPEDQPATMLIYQHVILNLARMQVTNSAEDLKRFKEEITKVGHFLALPKKKRFLMFYLRLVYQLITQSAYEAPSSAVAIVFELFTPDLIIEAVQSLLDLNVPDDSIRKTVGLLCKWISVCNFCQNLNLWIMALLQGLHEQEKYLLLDEIAMDNIDQLFMLMIFPALRPKVAPIVFHMLSTINQAPEIFHKVSG